MSEIRPSDSLIAALSNFADSRSAAKSGQAGPGSGLSRAQLQADIKARTVAANAISDAISTNAAKSSETSRVQLSSADEVEKARANIRQADENARFKREAPNVSAKPQYQPPGQIVDIKV